MNASNLGAGTQAVKRPPIITLLTDFGLQDAYVGVMKGVILSICPTARVVDLTHAIPPQDVLAGCLELEAARPHFPSATVHLTVIDPGVGTDRAPVAARTARDVLVGPDNGVFSCVPEAEILAVHRIENPEVLRRPVSRTFHGRDVFAPAAAHLAAGFPLARVGPILPGISRLALPVPARREGKLTGEILIFDHFGNAVTNLREEDLSGTPGLLRAGGHDFPLLTTYADAGPGGSLALIGSTGRVELSVRNGSARETLGLRRGAPVTVGP